jgi:hypothetical protein
MKRAVRWDGILPVKYSADGQSLGDEGNNTASGMTLADIREMKAYIHEQRLQAGINPADSPYDIVIGGTTPGEDPTRAVDVVRPYAEAGATWWLEAVWKTFYAAPGDIEILRKRIKQGPPRP